MWRAGRDFKSTQWKRPALRRLATPLLASVAVRKTGARACCVRAKLPTKPNPRPSCTAAAARGIRATVIKHGRTDWSIRQADCLAEARKENPSQEHEA